MFYFDNIIKKLEKEKLERLENIIPKYIYNQTIPKDVLVVICEYIPIPLTDETIHDTVRNYVTSNTDNKQRVIKKFGRISNWDVTQVTEMGYLFNQNDYISLNFNEDISNWNVSNVTTMNGMFSGSTSFNQPLNNWDVSNVRNMESMFTYTTNFNQSLNNWDISNVTNMNWMFHYAEKFNQPLNDWNVSNVTTMRFMFSEATSFDIQQNAPWYDESDDESSDSSSDSSEEEELDDEWDRYIYYDKYGNKHEICRY